jgi:GTPase SAR1 family protein
MNILSYFYFLAKKNNNSAVLGKSTLINSLRNLPNCRQTENWTHDIFLAAPTGEKETTIETNQYGWRTDNAEIKYLRLWDSPGCGTINNRTETYFADRYLYVFYCLIMVTSGSLGEYELKILNDAGAYKRPVVIVLSQSELKAESKARDYYDRTNLSVDEYKPICDETSNEAKENMLDTILKARPDYPSLDVSSVFVVSAVKFRDFLKTNSETDALLSFETSKLLNYLLKEAEAKRIV